MEVRIGQARTLDDRRRVRRAFGIIALVSVVYAVVRLANYGEQLANFGSFLLNDIGGQVVLVSVVVASALAMFGGRTRNSEAHLVLVLGLLAGYHLLVIRSVPFEIEGIGSSYLIFFYHFPSAFNSLLFCTFVGVFSVMALVTRRELWSHCAFASAQIGLVALTVTLVSGSSWAKAAWGHWWVWDDARLVTAAVMWLVYAGYIVLYLQIDDPVQRVRYTAIHGIAALPSVGLVRFAIEWFGKTSHPAKFAELSSDFSIVVTRWTGVAVFFALYALLLRWRLGSASLARRTEVLLARIRRVEERGSRS